MALTWYETFVQNMEVIRLRFPRAFSGTFQVELPKQNSLIWPDSCACCLSSTCPERVALIWYRYGFGDSPDPDLAIPYCSQCKVHDGRPAGTIPYSVYGREMWQCHATFSSAASPRREDIAARFNPDIGRTMAVWCGPPVVAERLAKEKLRLQFRNFEYAWRFAKMNGLRWYDILEKNGFSISDMSLYER